MNASQASLAHWPELQWKNWQPTADTLHMWTQIVGKVRLALAPMQQHWWNVPLYISARGLTTSAMPVGEEYLDIEFDFVSHELQFRLSNGASRATRLRPQTVRDFYAEFQESLKALGLAIPIHPVPVEVPQPIPFAEDTTHTAYDAAAAHRFWRVLMSAERIFQRFSSGFVGKISPVHFFWGSFDLAVSRFSGRPAPARPDADAITQEAYSEEVISAGFWPGNGGYGKAAFYAYAVPQPAGFAQAKILPAAAGFNPGLGEFLFDYEAMRRESDPDAALMDFLQSAYEAGASLAGWDRKALERAPGSRHGKNPRSRSQSR
jgi:hypothetical protein